MKKAIGMVVGLFFFQGCVSLGFHQRELSRVRDEEFEFAYRLAKEVKNKEITASDMRYLLRTRYNLFKAIEE